MSRSNHAIFLNQRQIDDGVSSFPGRSNTTTGVSPSAKLILRQLSVQSNRTSSLQRFASQSNRDTDTLSPTAMIILKRWKDRSLSPSRKTRSRIGALRPSSIAFDAVRHPNQLIPPTLTPSPKRRNVSLPSGRSGIRKPLGAYSNARSKYHNLFQNTLLAASLKLQTQQKYSTAVRNFYMTLQFFPTTAQDLDGKLSEYILSRFRANQKRGERTKMGCLVAGLCALHPNLKGTLRTANRYLKGWDKLVPSQSSMPLTRELMKAFVAQLIIRQEKHCAMAVAFAWTGYLRGNEVLKLTWKDVGFAGDPRLSSVNSYLTGLNIVDGKTGQNQFVPITDLAVISMLRTFSAQTDCNPHARLFSISYRQYLGKIKEVATELHLGDRSFTTHSTRIGGALHDFIADKSVQDISIVGRWESLKTLRRYLTNGRGHLMTLDLTEASKSKIRQMNLLFSEWFVHDFLFS